MSTPSHVYPSNSAISASGHLTIAGCDVVDLAAEFGTPAYIVDEADLRARARGFRDGLRAANPQGEVVFAAKAFPATPVLAAIAQEGLSCLVASGGELAIALRAGFAPERITLHGNAKSLVECREAVSAGVGRVILDSVHDIDRLEAVLAAAGRRQDVLIRVTPDVSGDTHHAISTGQADSKFGFGVPDAAAAIERTLASEHLTLLGLHCHIGSQLLDLTPFVEAVQVLAGLGDFELLDFGGGLGASYLADQESPSVAGYVQAIATAAEQICGAGQRIAIEPGRSLVANTTVTLYTVESVKRNVSNWVSVDGGMSDNPRPMLYQSRYEAAVATRMDRAGSGELCNLAGKHCESGDVIVRDIALDAPRVGDLVVTPATGAYGYAMASNYNGVPRAPVIFCRDGDARLVVRRERYADLFTRDV